MTEMTEMTDMTAVTDTPIITDTVKLELSAWCEAFRRRWMFQPPEFWKVINIGDFEGHYELDAEGRKNPIHSPWFADLIRSGTAADLDAIETCLAGSVINYLRYFQMYILSRICEGHETWYSPHIIPWFRAKGWKVEDPSCYCGHYDCKHDCGVLVCGCIDMCRGRCGMRDWNERY
jgi:hypothetical protein